MATEEQLPNEVGEKQDQLQGHLDTQKQEEIHKVSDNADESEIPDEVGEKQDQLQAPVETKKHEEILKENAGELVVKEVEETAEPAKVKEEPESEMVEETAEPEKFEEKEVEKNETVKELEVGEKQVQPSAPSETQKQEEATKVPDEPENEAVEVEKSETVEVEKSETVEPEVEEKQVQPSAPSETQKQEEAPKVPDEPEVDVQISEVGTALEKLEDQSETVEIMNFEPKEETSPDTLDSPGRGEEWNKSIRTEPQSTVISPGAILEESFTGLCSSLVQLFDLNHDNAATYEILKSEYGNDDSVKIFLEGIAGRQSDFSRKTSLEQAKSWFTDSEGNQQMKLVQKLLSVFLHVHEKMFQDVLTDMFNWLDDDADAKLTLEELRDSLSKKANKFLEGLDHNKDGVLCREDFENTFTHPNGNRDILGVSKVCEKVKEWKQKEYEKEVKKLAKFLHDFPREKYRLEDLDPHLPGNAKAYQHKLAASQSHKLHAHTLQKLFITNGVPDLKTIRGVIKVYLDIYGVPEEAEKKLGPREIGKSNYKVANFDLKNSKQDSFLDERIELSKETAEKADKKLGPREIGKTDYDAYVAPKTSHKEEPKAEKIEKKLGPREIGKSTYDEYVAPKKEENQDKQAAKPIDSPFNVGDVVHCLTMGVWHEAKIEEVSAQNATCSFPQFDYEPHRSYHWKHFREAKEHPEEKEMEEEDENVKRRPEARSNFAIGMTVELFGTKKEAMNGKRGMITGDFFAEKGRWPVTLEDSKKLVKVKPENLKVVTIKTSSNEKVSEPVTKRDPKKSQEKNKHRRRASRVKLPPLLKIGMRVKVHGTKKQELNGKIGNIVGQFDKAKKRWPVKIPGQKKFNIKPENLKAL